MTADGEPDTIDRILVRTGMPHMFMMFTFGVMALIVFSVIPAETYTELGLPNLVQPTVYLVILGLVIGAFRDMKWRQRRHTLSKESDRDHASEETNDGR